MLLYLRDLFASGQGCIKTKLGLVLLLKRAYFLLGIQDRPRGPRTLELSHPLLAYDDKITATAVLYNLRLTSS